MADELHIYKFSPIFTYYPHSFRGSGTRLGLRALWFWASQAALKVEQSCQEPLGISNPPKSMRLSQDYVSWGSSLGALVLTVFGSLTLLSVPHGSWLYVGWEWQRLPQQSRRPHTCHLTASATFPPPRRESQSLPMFTGRPCHSGVRTERSPFPSAHLSVQAEFCFAFLGLLMTVVRGPKVEICSVCFSPCLALLLSAPRLCFRALFSFWTERDIKRTLYFSLCIHTFLLHDGR